MSDEEWAVVAPYLAVVREDAPQRRHDLRDVFNGLRWLLRTGAEWRMLPHSAPRDRRCVAIYGGVATAQRQYGTASAAKRCPDSPVRRRR